MSRCMIASAENPSAPGLHLGKDFGRCLVQFVGRRQEPKGRIEVSYAFFGPPNLVQKKSSNEKRPTENVGVGGLEVDRCGGVGNRLFEPSQPSKVQPTGSHRPAPGCRCRRVGGRSLRWYR